MSNNNSVINAVKRLERVGSENSKATKKLFQAATAVAELIEEVAPVGVTLPRGYKVVERRSKLAPCLFLVNKDGEYIDGIGQHLHGDFHCWIPEQRREVILDFAADIADGLLNEIADFIEQLAMESNKATEVLEEKLAVTGEAHE